MSNRRERTGAGRGLPAIGLLSLLVVLIAGCDGGEVASPTATATTTAVATAPADEPTPQPSAGDLTARAGSADEIEYATVEDGALDITEQTEAEDGPPRGYSFTWSEIDGVPIVGAAVYTQMQAIYEDFQAEVGAPSPDARISQDVTITAELIAASDEVIGVRLDIFKFYGANGAAETRTLWFDVQDDEPYPAIRMLDGQGALDRIAELSGEALERDRPDLGPADLAAGTEPTDGNFDAIGFTTEGDLIIEFDEGQVGAMSSGWVVISGDVESLLSDFGRRARLAVTTPASVSTHRPCPVDDVACDLAREFLPAMQTMDAQAIAERAIPQDIKCPGADSTSGFAFALAGACEGVEPATPVEVWEIHNGKGPFCYPTVTEYTDAITTDFSSMVWQEIVAVGCGTFDPEAMSPDCDRAVVALYGDPISDLHVALIFLRSRETSEWRIEKLWFPFPSVIPSPIPEQLEVGINSVGGVLGATLVPYSDE